MNDPNDASLTFSPFAKVSVISLSTKSTKAKDSELGARREWRAFFDGPHGWLSRSFRRSRSAGYAKSAASENQGGLRRFFDGSGGRESAQCGRQIVTGNS
jgi:hypothetical protein